MFLVTLRAGTVRDFTIAINESDGTTPITLAAEDVVRVKIGRIQRGGLVLVPILDLSSNVVTPGGSTVTFTAGTNQARVRFGEDTVSMSGTYDVELAVVDASETAPPDAIKHVEAGTLHIFRIMG